MPNDIDEAISAVLAEAEDLIANPGVYWLIEDTRNDNLA